MRDFGCIVLIFSLMMLVISSGCAGSKWKEYNYGPADWISDNTSAHIDTPYNYERFQEPAITVTVVDSVLEACGSYAKACALVSRDSCEIFVGERASPKTMAHELRHCHGWSHYQPRFDMFSSMDSSEINRELVLAQKWFPARAVR